MSQHQNPPIPQGPPKGALLAAQVESRRFSGPLPPPEILEHYERIVPGAGERILKMAENQAQHRQNIEVKLVVSGLVNERIGAIGATIVSLGFLGGAVYSIASGYPAAGTFLGTLDILALVYAFRVGRT